MPACSAPPTSMLATTAFVSGSMRTTCGVSNELTQAEPAPKATP
jgi:hypothetical protein